MRFSDLNIPLALVAGNISQKKELALEAATFESGAGEYEPAHVDGTGGN